MEKKERQMGKGAIWHRGKGQVMTANDSQTEGEIKTRSSIRQSE